MDKEQAGSECLTMSVERAARILGIGRGLCYQMIHEGRIPHLVFGRRIVVPKAGLDKLLNTQGNDGKSEDIEHIGVNRKAVSTTGHIEH